MVVLPRRGGDVYSTATRIVVALATLGLVAPTAAGAQRGLTQEVQAENTSPGGQLDRTPAGQRDRAGQQVEQRRPPSQGAALLDAPVSRSQYVLGPGDGVELSVFGDLNRLHSLAVTPEGSLVIPMVGVVDVLGLNLDQAQARVRERVFRLYRNVDVHLTLSQVRQFKVFMVGDVPEQGVQVASSATRVSEIIENLPANPDRDGAVMRRNVTVRRANGESVEVDLARFRQAGDLSMNPLLREGDVLVVPSVDRTVHVYGRVAFAGPYEYRSDESLAGLLEVANGGAGFLSDAADTVRVSRFVAPEQREFFTFTRADATGAQGRQFILQPFDAVYVPRVSNFMRQRVAVVEGQVVRPGTYPIRPDTTTVRELVAMAGGLRPQASLVSATLRRDPDARGNLAMQRLQEVPGEFLSREDRRILQIQSQADESAVVVDFQRLFLEGAGTYDQPLRSGDVLTIPVQRNEVQVLGAVLQPGIVQHVPGRTVNDFIALAGGYSRRASRGDLVVLRAQSGARISAREARVVEPGDAIIVPYREPINLLQSLQVVSTVAATVTSLILTYTLIR